MQVAYRNVTSKRAFNAACLLPLFSAVILAAGCATVQPGPYEISAYDEQGKVIKTANITVTDTRSLAVPLNGFCIAYPKSRVVARPADGSKPVERKC